MNYVNLTNNSWNFDNIWKKVDIDEECRIDAIIAEDCLLCSDKQQDSDSSRRDYVLDKIIQLCNAGGIKFILFTSSKDLLYSKSDELRKRISWFQRKVNFFFEIRYINLEAFKEKGIKNNFIIVFYSSSSIIFDTSEFGYPDNQLSEKYDSANNFIITKINENLF